MKAGSSAGAGAFDQAAGAAHDEQQQQSEQSDEQKKRKALIKARARKDRQLKKQQQTLLSMFERQKQDAIVIDDDDEEEEAAAPKAWEEEKAATSKQGSVNQMALASKRRQEHRRREQQQQQQEMTGSSKKAGSSKDAAILIDGDDDEEAETERRPQQQAQAGPSRQAAVVIEDGKKPTPSNQQQPKEEGGSRAAAIIVDDEEDAAPKRQQEDRKTSSSASATFAKVLDARVDDDVQKKQPGSSKAVTVDVDAEEPLADGPIKQEIKAESSTAAASDLAAWDDPIDGQAGSSVDTAIDVDEAPADEEEDYLQHGPQVAEEEVAPAPTTGREALNIAAQGVRTGIKRKKFAASQITESMLEDLEAFLDIREEYGDMRLVLCKNNRDLGNLNYVPEKLEECDAACVYWSTIEFDKTRVPDDRLPEGDDADYVGMTGKSGKIRAKGHLWASVIYILRRFYAAWRVAKERTTVVTFRSPGTKVLGTKIRTRYGTDWGLNDDELEVAYLSTVEAVDIAHRRSCRIASELQYVTWLDCTSGTPLPRTVGLNSTTGLSNELARFQGRQRAKAAAAQPAPDQQTLDSLWTTAAQQSSSVAAPTASAAQQGSGVVVVPTPTTQAKQSSVVVANPIANKAQPHAIVAALPAQKSSVAPGSSQQSFVATSRAQRPTPAATGKIVPMPAASEEMQVQAFVDLVTTCGRLTSVRTHKGSPKNSRDDAEDTIVHDFCLPICVLGKSTHLAISTTDAKQLGIDDTPGTTTVNLKVVKRTAAAGRLALMGSLEDYRNLALWNVILTAADGKSVALSFCRRQYLGGVWSDFLAVVGDHLGRAALDDIVRPSWATWAWADLIDIEDRPEGWSESLYYQCFNSVLGNCRHSGTWTEGVIRTTLVLPDGKSSLVRMPQPPKELKGKLLDVVWGDNPATDALKYAWKEREDMTPVGDGDWIDYLGHEGHWSDVIADFHDCCRLLVGLGKKAVDLANTPIGYMPDWYVAQMVQGPGLPLGTVAHIFGVRLQRKEPLSRPFGTNPILFFIIIEKNKEGIRYKDPNGPEEKFVPAKPKSKALELVNGLKAYLAKVEAGEAGREIEGDRKHPARAKKAGKDGEKASKDGKKAGKNDEKAGEDEQAAADGSTAKGNGAAKAGSSKKRANERVGEPGASKKSKKKE